MPTITKQVGPGKFYETLILWEVDLDLGTIYNSGDIAKADCFKGAVFNGNHDITGGATIGLIGIEITAGPTERHTGIAGSGVKLHYGTGFFSLKLSALIHTTVEWLEITTSTGGGTNQVGIRVVAPALNHTIKNNIVHRFGGNPGADAITGGGSFNTSYIATNNIVYDCRIGVGSNAVAHIGEFYNNTVHNAADVGYFLGSSNKIENCIATSSGVSDFSGSPSVESHNMSSDSTAAGVGSLTVKIAADQFISTVPGSENLHLLGTSSAIDKGKDLGVTPPGVEIDINGRNRDTNADAWDMGAHELASVMSGIITASGAMSGGLATLIEMAGVFSTTGSLVGDLSSAINFAGIITTSGSLLGNLIKGSVTTELVNDMMLVNDADSSLNWNPGDDTAAVAIEPDIKVQGINSVSSKVTSIVNNGGLMLDLLTNQDYSNTHILVWFFTMQAFNTQANGGVRIRVSSDFDGLDNYGEWFVRGSDNNVGPRASFQPLVVDTSRAFDNSLNVAPALTAIRSVGVICNFSSANGRISFFVDIMRKGNNGLNIFGGTLPFPSNALEVAADDGFNSNSYGMFVKSGGVFLLQGLQKFGTTLPLDSYFKEVNSVWAFTDQPVSSVFNRIECIGSAANVNQFILGDKIGTGISANGISGVTILAEGTVPFRFIAIDINSDVRLYGGAFLNSGSAGGFIQLEHVNVDCVSRLFSKCDTVSVKGGATLKKATITDSIAPSTSAALDLGGTNPNAVVDTVRDVNIIKGVNGLLLKGSGDIAYDLPNFTFSQQTGKKIRVDFGAIDTVTINILSGGDTILQADLDKVDSGTTVIINNTVVTTSVTVLDGRTSPALALQNARVLLEASDAVGDLPFNTTVTITRAATTATVVHTAHGLVNGNLVVIRKAVQPEYNGVKTVANVSANTYDFTVTGSPITPATGVIKATGVVISGLTDVNGLIQDVRSWTLLQSVKGVVRKSTTTPRFKSSPLTGAISTTTGLPITVQMIPDE